MTLLNFKYGNQSSLPAFSAAEKGTIYVTKDTNRLFIALPDGTDYVNTGDFQLVSFSSGTAANALANLANSAKRTNILYITVDTANSNATAMWRYTGTEFKAISNTAEIDGIKADISDLQTAVSTLNTFKDTTVPNTYMPKAGGQFSGNVSFASGKTLTVNTPSADAHAATKKYVDDAKSALLGNSSATTTTNATIYDVKRAAAAAQTTASNAATTAGNAMPKAGGTFTGNVNFESGKYLTVNTPVNDAHAATKAYVDSAKSGAQSTAQGYVDTAKTAILGTNDDGTDFAGTVKGAYAAAASASTAAGNANDNANGRVSKGGDTMTGLLTLSGAPTANLHAATKQYVDEAKTSAINTAAGDATSKANAVLGTSGDSASANTVYGAKAAAAAAATTAGNAMPKAGGTFTGNVSMGSGKTLTVNTPTADGHAATKAYVDSAASTAKSGAEATAQGYVNTLKGNSTDSADTVSVYGAIAKAAAAATAASNANDNANGRAPTSHASTATTYGAGTSSNYGHVKLSDSTTSTSASSAGVAATPKAVNDARTALIGTSSSASSTDTIYGAKKYADEKVATVATNLGTLEGKIGNLSNIMNFLGTTTSDVKQDATITSIVIDSDTVTAVKGDVVVKGAKEFVFDGAKWQEIGDVSAQATAISGLQTRMNTAETNITGLRTDLGTNDNTSSTAFARIKALETWKGTHSTEYSNLNTTVSGHSAAIGAASDTAKADGSLYARIAKNVSDISSHNTRIGTLESWKTSHSSEYTALANRVTALETWKGTHSTEYTNLSNTVSGNSDAIDALTLVLTWGTF